MTEIEIVKGNIVFQDVDAIVNAAHEALMGGGGVDGAIHRAAGPALLRECRAFPESSPGVRCAVGEAYMTQGHNLKAKAVIHTVAPKFVGSVHKNALMQDIYKNAKEGTDEDLARCYKSCMALAALNELKSIAFPSLGTGGHAYPIEIACPIALRAVAEAEAPTLELVRFVCFSDHDYAVYTSTAKKMMGDKE